MPDIDKKLLNPNYRVRFINPPDGEVPSFFLHELRCHTKEMDPCPHCHGSVVVIPYGLELLNRLRTMVYSYNENTGMPRGIKLNRSYSCEKHNAEIPNASPNSVHKWGGAYDIDSSYSNMTSLEMARMAEAAGFQRVGVYDWGIHVDIGYEMGLRPGPAKWGDWGE